MSKINEWLDKDKLILLEGWARQGLTEEQIAKNMGISVKTLYNWKNKELQILQALKKGKEVVDFEVENSLFKRAMGYEYTEETYECGILTKKVKKQIPPDTTAIIYWLNNRKPEYWRNKHYIQNEKELTKVDELLEEIKNNAIK